MEGTLSALISQRCPPSLQWEIIVVDNNSRDTTPKVVAAFSKTAPVPVRYVFEPKLGLSNARNRGIQEAQGSIVAFTDDDVLPAPDWVAGVCAAMDRWCADGIGGRILLRWETSPPQWLRENPLLLAHLALMDSEESCVLPSPMGQRPQVWGANMAFRRSVFAKVGTFDARRGMTGRKFFRGEEIDLINRASQAGLRIAYDASLTVFHRIHPDRMRRSYFRKLFFNIGEGEAPFVSLAGRRTLLGVPPWLFRRVFTQFWICLALTLRRHPLGFERQLLCLSLAGRIWGHWKNRQRFR